MSATTGTDVGTLTRTPDGYITGAQHNEWRKVYDRMCQVFAKAAAKRPTHADRHAIVESVDAAGRTTPQMFFVDYEMRAMHAEVNTQRAAAGLAPVDLAAIALCEQQAAGHVDYAIKYPLYCADLVCFGTSRRL